MDAPETEVDGRAEADRPVSSSGAVPLAFGDRDPAALDDATELYLLDRHAEGDTVRVQVLGWERDGDVVRVTYALPTGERLCDRYRWPTAGRYDRSDFLALVRGLGYPPGAADLVAGEFARARNRNGRWRIVTGRRPSEGAAAGEGGDRAPRNETNGGGRTGRDTVRLRTFTDLRRRVRGADPMTTGTVAVALFALAVGVPASVASVTGGLSAALTGVGGALFLTALATLWLSIAAAP